MIRLSSTRTRLSEAARLELSVPTWDSVLWGDTGAGEADTALTRRGESPTGEGTGPDGAGAELLVTVSSQDSIFYLALIQLTNNLNRRETWLLFTAEILRRMSTNHNAFAKASAFFSQTLVSAQHASLIRCVAGAPCIIAFVDASLTRLTLWIVDRAELWSFLRLFAQRRAGGIAKSGLHVAVGGNRIKLPDSIGGGLLCTCCAKRTQVIGRLQAAQPSQQVGVVKFLTRRPSHVNVQ